MERICNHCKKESVLKVAINDQNFFLCVDEFLKLQKNKKELKVMYPFSRGKKGQQLELSVKILEIFSESRDSFDFGFLATDKNIALVSDQMSYMIKIFPELNLLEKNNLKEMIINKNYPQYKKHIEAINTKQDLLGFITEIEERKKE